MDKNYKFQDLKIYRLALDYLNPVCKTCKEPPHVENFNIRSQWERATTSIVLNIAEGSTSQSDPEQSRFLGMAPVPVRQPTAGPSGLRTAAR